MRRLIPIFLLPLVFVVFTARAQLWQPPSKGTRAAPAGGFVLSSYVNTACSEADGSTTCTTTSPVTVAAGDILVSGIYYCMDNGCNPYGNATAILTATGTGAVGTCHEFTNASDFVSNIHFVTDLWWCPVTTSGTVSPKFTISVLNFYYSAITGVNIHGASSTPDDGVGNHDIYVGAARTSVSLSLTGAGASQANELLLYLAWSNSAAGATITPSGYVDFGSTGMNNAYKTNGGTGANTLTLSFPSNTTYLPVSFVAIKHP